MTKNNIFKLNVKNVSSLLALKLGKNEESFLCKKDVSEKIYMCLDANNVLLGMA